MVETPTPSTPSDKPTRGLTANDLLSSSKEHSTVTNKTIIPQNSGKYMKRYLRCMMKDLEAKVLKFYK
ncbi:hypothetical protein [Aliarcobacter lanthieri]|uniref:hypothetical protein n=1 Tax=Aliarcobacter lanthieri TaxID=1355374 RepID=UPI0011DE27A3|nr:hypothetical protein [Aliarcobacter lanthieri]